MAKPQREETHLMTFLERNAGPEGNHGPGDQHEIGAEKARALAFDRVAEYADKDMQEQHMREYKSAHETNERRVAAGLSRLPIGHPALRPGAENAMARFGGPGGTDPRSSLESMSSAELQKLADQAKAREKAAKSAPSEGQ